MVGPIKKTFFCVGLFKISRTTSLVYFIIKIIEGQVKNTCILSITYRSILSLIIEKGGGGVIKCLFKFDNSRLIFQYELTVI